MRLFLNRNEKDKLDNYDEILSELKYERDVNASLTKDGTALFILAKGCSTHPSYRAHRAPLAACEACKKMASAMKHLLDRGLNELKGRKPGKKAKS